ncbi:leucine-rich repeat-containing protein 38 [Synchiropus splendidus]|uniref:leucine-rich repeat-containing protein 38 n=1 Tax=Synchiropus splendidus TaxID=270530 RepID=UPI00237E6214|nr:leucine-rich repeat-containing protein 38 [Synchiropus splendidus]XP_053738802.1 leucine-rich repeat-containing protein 38 [Synchiropus splendidus]
MSGQWTLLLLLPLLVKTRTASPCVCPAAVVHTRLPAQVAADVCCLNFSGSSFGDVDWSVFTNQSTVLEILDLSWCNITTITFDAGPTALHKVHLNHNRLESLPQDFLSSQPQLTELDLSWNVLQELPDEFLQDSNRIQHLYLQGNKLRFLPVSVLKKPELQSLDLGGNLWDCSCAFLENLEERRNRTLPLKDLVGNLTCVTPRSLADRLMWSVQRREVCQPAALTALFVTLPLLILATLVICWCCGRKAKKEAPVFGTSKKRPSTRFPGQQPESPEPDPGPDILKNQLLLRPMSEHLSSIRDIYEEVKLGSVASLPRGSSPSSSCSDRLQSSQEPDRSSRGELDTVSVTEVLKDSADREKAYMTQSTKYYSLVPGLELEDSDHGGCEDAEPN